MPGERAAARDPRLDRRAAGPDLRRHGRRAGVPRHRPLRAAVPRRAAGRPGVAASAAGASARLVRFARPAVAQPPPRGEHRPRVAARAVSRSKKCQHLSHFGDDLRRRGRLAPLLDSPVVDLERLIAALAPAEVVGRVQPRSRDLAYDARARRRRGALLLRPRRARRRARLRAGGGRERRGRARRRAPARPGRAAARRRRRRARRWRSAADEFFGRPTEELAVAGVTGTNGKTTTAFLLYAVLAAAGRRPAARDDRDACRTASAAPATRTTPEAIDLQRLFREMLDAGDRSCAMEATSHGVGAAAGSTACASRRSSSRTSTRTTSTSTATMEDYFDAKRRLFVGGAAPPAAVNVGDAYGRRLAEELRTRARRSSPSALRRATSDELERPRRLVAAVDASRLRGRFNVENVLGAVAAARLLGVDDDAVARGIASVERRARAASRRSTRGSRSPSSSTTRTSRTRSRTCSATARELADRPRDLRLRLRRRPRPRQAPADGPDRRPSSPTSRSSPPTTRAARIRWRSSRRSSPGSSGELEVEPDRAAAIERAIELARAGRRRRDRRQGPRARPGDRAAASAVRRPRGGARGAAARSEATA